MTPMTTPYDPQRDAETLGRDSMDLTTTPIVELRDPAEAFQVKVAFAMQVLNLRDNGTDKLHELQAVAVDVISNYLKPA